MSKLNYCQGTKCHTYDTTDRKRGSKDNRRNQTRSISTYSYGNGNFCTLTCQNDWWNDHGERAVDHFGRIHQPKHLTEHNAWVKDYDWHGGTDDRTHLYYLLNKITKERRTITEEQYNNREYTLNT